MPLTTKAFAPLANNTYRCMYVVNDKLYVIDIPIGKDEIPELETILEEQYKVLNDSAMLGVK